MNRQAADDWVMGWQFRKSVNLGPFRVNLSKSGIGYSVGGAGFRTGVSAGGRKYSSIGIPGTGLRYVKSGGGPASGCLPVMLGFVGLTTWVVRRFV
jgi:Protein of unknown function (DUF4236)